MQKQNFESTSPLTSTDSRVPNESNTVLITFLTPSTPVKRRMKDRNAARNKVYTDLGDDKCKIEILRALPPLPQQIHVSPKRIKPQINPFSNLHKGEQMM